MAFSPGIERGSILNNDQLCALFGCSPQGGMRRSLKTETLILVSNHVASIYDDRWVDGIFHYTGMGQTGDQSLTSTQNKTLAESGKNNVGIHLFEVVAFPQFSRQILLSKSEWEKCKCKKPNTQLNSKKRQFAKLSTGATLLLM